MQEWCKSSWSWAVKFTYGPEDCHELQLTHVHYVRLTKAVTCWEVPLSSLVNKSPMRCSLFHFVYFRSTCFGHGACPSSGVVCKNCRGSHQCVSMRMVCVRWVRVGCPWGWCVYWSPSYTKLAQSWVSETCRAKINKVKQAASRWWLIYKTLRMHGTMNIKFLYPLWDMWIKWQLWYNAA